MQDRLREQWRVRAGRSNQPSAAVVNAQSTRSSPQGGDSDFDAAEEVKGRKRNLVVDTMVCYCPYHDCHERSRSRCRRRYGHAFTDGAYSGKCARDIEQLHHIRVEVVRRPGNSTTGTLHNPRRTSDLAAESRERFVVQPKRWVVEPTPAWT